MCPPKILVVDDQPINVQMLKRKLASEGVLRELLDAGVADAADILFTAVTGATVEALVIYRDTGTPGTSRLIAYIDSATGLPFAPSGADVTVQWDNGINKIFKL